MLFSLVELQILAGLAAGKPLVAIGDRLYLSQPAVSKILHAAERKCGVTLVAQRGRRLY